MSSSLTTRTIFTARRALLPSSPVLARRAYAGYDQPNATKTPHGPEEPKSSDKAKVITVVGVSAFCALIFFNFNPFRHLSPPVNVTAPNSSADYEGQSKEEGATGGGGLGRVVGGSDKSDAGSSAWKSTQAAKK